MGTLNSGLTLRCRTKPPRAKRQNCSSTDMPSSYGTAQRELPGSSPSLGTRALKLNDLSPFIFFRAQAVREAFLGLLRSPTRPRTRSKKSGEACSSSITSLGGLASLTLKGVAFEARENAKIEADGPLWLGVSEAAERYREIQVRRRTGRGVWYAHVEILRWDAVQRTGEAIASFSERCDSKVKAEEAARRLLTENAKYFTAETSVEAEVLCELEWDEGVAAKLL